MNKIIEPFRTKNTSNDVESEELVEVEPAVEEGEPGMIQVYASFKGNESVIIEVDADGADYAVESFYNIGAVFAAPVK